MRTPVHPAGARRVLALLAVVAASLMAATPASADYGPVRHFGTPGTGPGQFNSPLGVGVGPDGHVFVADGLNDRVQELMPDGTYVRSYGQTGTQRGDLRLPEDALSDGTSLFVTDCYNGRVTQYALGTGKFVNAWGRDQHPGDPTFSCPENLAMSAGGVLYVADTFNQRVVSFDPHATAPAFQSFGSLGTGPGQFTQVHALQFDQAGNLLVGDDDPHTCTYARIQRFSPDGTYLGPFGTFQAGIGAGHLFCIWDIDQDVAGNVFVSDAAARVYAFSPDGTLLRQVNMPGQMGFALGLDSNSNCELYTVDRNGARIVVFGWPDEPRCRALTAAPLPGTTLPPDTTPPALVASVAATSRFGAPLRVSVACPLEDCTLRASATAALGRSAVRTVLASGRATLVDGRRRTVSLGLSRSMTARVRKYLRTHRRLRVTVRLTAIDKAGNRTIRSLPTDLRPVP